MVLTAEQRLVQDMVRRFAKDELQPVASDIDKEAVFPREIIKKLSELGFMGIIVPEQYEGASLDAMSYCIIIEELSKVLASVGMILIAHNALVVYSILKYGNDEQKKRWLPALSRGDTIGAFALTEERAGADFSTIETEAKKGGNNYIISGEKNFVVNAEVAGLFIVFARRENGITPFLLNKEREGVEVSAREEVLGMRASGVCNLKLENVKVSDEDVLGKGGNGLEIVDDVFNFANLGVASLGVGIGESCLEESLKYSKERHQFGRAICEFQLVQEMLVEMKVRVTQTRLLTRNAAIKYNSGEDAKMDIALAKLCATDGAMYCGIKAVQVHGGYGYTKDYPVERYFRDAKVSQAWGGTSTVQKSKIASLLLE